MYSDLYLFLREDGNQNNLFDFYYSSSKYFREVTNKASKIFKLDLNDFCCMIKKTEDESTNSFLQTDFLFFENIYNDIFVSTIYFYNNFLKLLDIVINQRIEPNSYEEFFNL